MSYYSNTDRQVKRPINSSENFVKTKMLMSVFCDADFVPEYCVEFILRSLNFFYWSIIVLETLC